MHIHIQHFDALALSPESRLEMEVGRQRNVASAVTVSKVMRLQVTSDQVTVGVQGVESRRAGAGGGEEE